MRIRWSRGEHRNHRSTEMNSVGTGGGTRAKDTGLAMHTVLYARMIPTWREGGYHVKLIFLSLPSVALAIERVASRVTQGGHNVPEETIRRRFESGLLNFRSVYRTLVDSWMHYDNSGPAPRLLEEGENR